ncbi:MAG: DEAD/DEAH box helicase family protein, partial [Candidatus Omnitrophota bacterium]
MNSNFDFLTSEWPQFRDAALNAEKNTFSAPRTCAFYCRYTLEITVNWMYENDTSLKKPFQDKLATLIHEPTFQHNLGTGLFQRIRYLQQLGNHAAHDSRKIKADESFLALKTLFAFLSWFSRTYSKQPPPPPLFKESLIPKTGEADKNTKQLQSLQEQLAQNDETLREERRKHAEYSEQIKKLQEEILELKQKNRETLIPQDYTEEETRERFIDLLLREAGWDLDSNHVSIEYQINGMPNKSETGVIDYVLWGANHLPLALVEAKRTKKDPGEGQHQAKLYADCLEQETGQRPVIFYTNGYETWIWDDTDYPPRLIQGFYTADELQLLINRRTNRKPLESIPIDTAIVSREYHHKGIRRITEDFTAKRRKALVVMATGTGKTQFSIALVKLLMQANWTRRVLFLADRISLVTQAKRRFNERYPNASTVNLLEEKEQDQSRIVFSTYPTMMNCIDETRGKGIKRFGVGHFDLIIIDEAHRSIYLKYKAIFNYFDALLVGLTATPKDEVDRNTFNLFDLQTHVPTFYYELDTAVKEKYLVPPRAFDVPLKFTREGIRYNDLSEEEKEEYEAHFYDEETDTMPDNIPASALNEWLFNTDTINKVLDHLMEYGHKIKGGEKLGKTIIFAQNYNHAREIEKCFNKRYPHFKGDFLQIISYKTAYAQNLIDTFSLSHKNPFIAVSVDMLDTGIDIHEILNLVIFKAVHSKVKFHQMIGRGTRTCPDLFGPGKDKENFLVFDFCSNFEFFEFNPKGISPGRVEPLSQRIFKKRFLLSHRLKDPIHRSNPDAQHLLAHLLDTLHQDVKNLDTNLFFIRPHRQSIETFSERTRWDRLNITDISDINEELSPLMAPADDDEIARRFDRLILDLQLNFAENTCHWPSYMKQLRKITGELQNLGNIPAVNQHMERIRRTLTETFAQSPSLWELELVRIDLRNLVKFID